MRKLITLIAVVALTAVFAGAQTTRPAAKTPPRPAPAAPAKQVTEISAADWSALAAALSKEDWTQAAQLAKQHLGLLRTDNERKQLAQLRYLYLFALAGKVQYYLGITNDLEAERSWTELDNAVGEFVGREIVLPPRPFSTSCEKRLNYVCPVKDTPNAFRTTATTKGGDFILSFDYVVFGSTVDMKDFDARATFLGGTLQRAEFNNDTSKPWIMRLFINRGFARINIF